MTWTFTTSGAAYFKAGENANVSGADVILGTLCDQAEGQIVAQTRKDYIAGYSALNTQQKNILNDVCSSLIAIQIIQYDMSGYTDGSEAQTMLDVQYDIAQKGIGFLKDFKSNTIKSV